MSVGLPVSRIVSVNVVLTPLPAQFQNFDSLLVIGDSNVINITDRIRSYGTLQAVAADFGTTAPEYLAAQLFFSQVPAPTQLYIGRWAQTATSGLLLGGVLTAAQQALANWTSITTGAFKIAVDGGSATGVSSLNFSSASSLNSVAATIQTAVRALSGAFAAVSVTWSAAAGQFIFTSGTTGASSAVAALTAPVSGTDISGAGLLAGTTATLQEIVPGIAAETALAAVVALDSLRTQWYGMMFASTHIVDADHLAIAAYIEASGLNPHVYGLTTNEAAALTTNDSTSIGFQLKALGYERTLCQWSANAYAVASFFGRAFTVDFTENNSTITMMFKVEPGVIAESLTTTQANALDSSNYNYFVNFNNNTAIIVNGKMAGGNFFDEIWGLDWLANQILTSVYNLLYTSPTKIPQTDAGVHLLATTIEGSCSAAVNNGLVAPGIWNAAGFGQLNQGDFLSKGYYVYAPPVATQNPADRAARKSPPIQVAVKLAGAIQSVQITVNVNR